MLERESHRDRAAYWATSSTERDIIWFGEDIDHALNRDPFASHPMRLEWPESEFSQPKMLLMQPRNSATGTR